MCGGGGEIQLPDSNDGKAAKACQGQMLYHLQPELQVWQSLKRYNLWITLARGLAYNSWQHATSCLHNLRQWILKGGSITVPLTSCLTGLDWSVLQIKTKILCSYSWFQTSQTGGQWYSNSSPFSIPCLRQWQTSANRTKRVHSFQLWKLSGHALTLIWV